MARYLDIGPDTRPGWFKRRGMKKFETLDAVAAQGIDHVCDCRKLPFPDHTFEVVHASHVIEHMEWWEVEAVVAEWARVLTVGGTLELWFPDAVKIMKHMIELDETGVWKGPEELGRYLADLDQGDPWKWCSKHLLHYPLHGNEYQRHRSLISINYLKRVMVQANLVNVREMALSELRGRDHPWINAGVVGTKQ